MGIGLETGWNRVWAGFELELELGGNRVGAGLEQGWSLVEAGLEQGLGWV